MRRYIAPILAVIGFLIYIAWLNSVLFEVKDGKIFFNKENQDNIKYILNLE